jgi:hypothetical protein
MKKCSGVGDDPHSTALKRIRLTRLTDRVNFDGANDSNEPTTHVQPGEYIEKRFSTSSGVSWFRGIVLFQYRALKSSFVGTLEAPPSCRVQVEWLNGDQAQTIDVADELKRGSVRVLGKLAEPPQKVQTAAECRALSDRKREQEDVYWQGRFDNLSDQAVCAMEDIVIADLLEMLLGVAAREEWMNQERRAAVIIRDFFKKVVHQRRLLRKHWDYIRGDFQVEMMMLGLSKAKEAAKTAACYGQSLRFPSAALLGSTELEALDAYDSPLREKFDDGALGLSQSLEVLKRMEDLAEEFGGILRAGFGDHTSLSRRLEQERVSDKDPLRSQVSASTHKIAASETPLLKPLQKLMFNMAAPSAAMGTESNTPAFTARKLKIDCQTANNMRMMTHPRNQWPIVSSVGTSLAAVLSRSQQDQLADEWGVTSRQRTGTSKRDSQAEVYSKSLSAHIAALRADTDVHGVVCTSDNVGHGNNKRLETTTEWMKELRYSDLPPSVEEKLSHSSSWVKMVDSGIHSEDDLLATESSDDLLRMNAILTFKAIDLSLDDQLPVDIGQAPSRAAVMDYGCKQRFSEVNYYFQYEEGDLKPRISRTASSDVGRAPGAHGTPIWARGCKMFPQLPQAFAKDETLIALVERGNARLGDGLSHSIAGDGAPTNALWKLGRVALQMHRKKEETGQSLDAGEVSELLNEPEHEEPHLQAPTNPLGDESSSDSSSGDESDNASCTSQQSQDQTGTSAAGNGRRTPRKSASALTEAQAKILLTTVKMIMGFWHCMQETIIVNLAGNNDEWSFFAREWRTTEGRLRFLLGAGNVNEALEELFSAVAGLVKWWLQRYRRSFGSEQAALSYEGFDEFMDREAATSPVLARLRALIEHTLLTKCMHDSMRQGMLQHVRLILEQLAELCAATGMYKYMRLIMDFRIQVATMPDADAAFLYDSCFIDMTSHMAPVDEGTEGLHNLYERIVGRHRRDRAWVRGVMRASCTMEQHEPGKSFGSGGKSSRPLTGTCDVNTFIEHSVRRKMQKHFPHGMAEWSDGDGVKHSYEARVGFGGALPPNGVDSQRTGRALAREDLKQLVFGGKAASSVKRKNPRKVMLTTEAGRKAVERRAAQLASPSSLAIESVSYTKAEMLDDIKEYAKQQAIPLSVTATLQGTAEERQQFMPKNQEKRSLLAAALSRWRLNAPVACSSAHASLQSAESPFDTQVAAEKSMLERRAAARSRLKLGGKLVGIAMVGAPCSEEVDDAGDPLAQLSAWMHANSNLQQSTQGRAAAVESATRAGRGNFKGTPSGDEPSAIGRVFRILKANAKGQAGTGRAAQMTAARTFRRTAEIEALMKERKQAREKKCFKPLEKRKP